MSVEVNRVLAPITVLGAGRRIGLWVQGCRLACPGCASVDTWEPGNGRYWDEDELARELVAQIEGRVLDGLTITGGEPLDQAEQLAKVVEQVRVATMREVDVLVFTGYAASAASKRAGRLWGLIDAAVCGPYRQHEPSSEPLIASANQGMVRMSELGRARYPLTEEAERMQLQVTEGELVMVGLPRPGDLDRLAAALAQRGVHMGGASWLS